jgi:hypothetical protein
MATDPRTDRLTAALDDPTMAAAVTDAVAARTADLIEVLSDQHVPILDEIGALALLTLSALVLDARGVDLAVVGRHYPTLVEGFSGNLRAMIRQVIKTLPTLPADVLGPLPAMPAEPAAPPPLSDPEKETR